MPHSRFEFSGGPSQYLGFRFLFFNLLCNNTRKTISSPNLMSKLQLRKRGLAVATRWRYRLIVLARHVLSRNKHTGGKGPSMKTVAVT